MKSFKEKLSKTTGLILAVLLCMCIPVSAISASEDWEYQEYEEPAAETEHVHTWDDGVVVEPTCYSQGYTIYTCTTCGAVEYWYYTDMLPHSFYGSCTCVVCGAVNPDFTGALVPEYDQQRYDKMQKGNLTFVAYEPAGCFDPVYGKVWIDNYELSKNEYIVENDQYIKITVKEDVLMRLADGQYTIYIGSAHAYGGYITGTFYVIGTEEETPEETSEQEESSEAEPETFKYENVTQPFYTAPENSSYAEPQTVLPDMSGTSAAPQPQPSTQGSSENNSPKPVPSPAGSNSTDNQSENINPEPEGDSAINSDENTAQPEPSENNTQTLADVSSEPAGAQSLAAGTDASVSQSGQANQSIPQQGTTDIPVLGTLTVAAVYQGSGSGTSDGPTGGPGSAMSSVGPSGAGGGLVGTSETLGGGPSGVVTGNTAGPQMSATSSPGYKYIEKEDGSRIIVMNGIKFIFAGMRGAVNALNVPEEDETVTQPSDN